MASSFGTALRVTVFGQSHSPAIGCVIEGLPAGFSLDMDALRAFMARRAPGQASWATPRKEADEPKVLSGLNQRGETCGAPLAIMIENTNTRSGDYDDVLHVPRPGHADFAAQAKWHGHQDVPGGGHFSGRLTAPLCAAGGIALQMLGARGVRIGAHLLQVGDVFDEGFNASSCYAESAASLQAQLDSLADGRIFPAIDMQKSSTRRDDLLLTSEELEAINMIRRAFNGLKSDEAVNQVLELFSKTRNNIEFINIVKKQKWFY